MSLDISLYMDVDTGGPELHRVTLYEANYTHNITAMAREAGLYECIWCPEDHTSFPVAGALIGPLREGLLRMREDPERFTALNPENGWGSYDTFLDWVDRYLHACTEHPKASIHTWR